MNFTSAEAESPAVQKSPGHAAVMAALGFPSDFWDRTLFTPLAVDSSYSQK
jgi:hypothetical protein